MMSPSLVVNRALIGSISATVIGEAAANDGAVFTSLTATENVRVANCAAAPLSVTRTVTVYWPGPCASVGVHVKTPVVGLMTAPGGATVSEYVSVCAGKSASCPTTETVSAESSSTD